MRHNPASAEGSFFALPDHRILAVEGRDAATFAQAQFMSDVVALADGHWHWSGWLTPKGRVIALFAVVRFDAQALWLVLPDAAATDMATALRRFVFRSKVMLEPRDDLRVAGAFAAPSVAKAASIAGGRDAGLELDSGAPDASRTLRISKAHAPEDAIAAADWKMRDLAHGLPRLPASQAEQWTPQQLSLDRLRAYSVKKGCYPGQEIVARTHFLGQAKRGLALLEGETAIAVGSQVSDGSRDLGTVISSEGALALAVLPLGRDAATLHVDGIVLHERQLLDGLGR